MDDNFAELCDPLTGRRLQVERLTAPGGAYTGSAQIRVIGKQGGMLSGFGIAAYKVAQFAYQLSRLFPLGEWAAQDGAQADCERILTSASRAEQVTVLNRLIMRDPAVAREIVREVTGKS